MRILVLNTDYPNFLASLYETPGLCDAHYAAQLAARNQSLFGTADFYSRALIAHGHVARDVYLNNPWLQGAWAREHGLAPPQPQKATAAPVGGAALTVLKRRLRKYRSLLSPAERLLGLSWSLDAASREILLAQVEEFNPDAILNFDLMALDNALLKRLKKKGRILAFYCGIDPPTNIDVTQYDFGLSMLDWVVDAFRAKGLAAEKCHLAFEPSVLDALGPAPEKDIAVSFVGSLLADHGQRIALLESIGARYPLAVWLPSLDGLSADSPLRACYRGQAYGRDLLDIMRRSEITLNTHVNAARKQAANARQFEATGVGSLLLTDNSGKLGDLFAPGQEAVTYDSVDDALAKLDYYLARDGEREAIARAGQKRTLSEHTYYRRAAQILDCMARYGR